MVCHQALTAMCAGLSILPVFAAIYTYMYCRCACTFPAYLSPNSRIVICRTCFGMRDTCPSWWMVKFSRWSASHASNCLVLCATTPSGQATKEGLGESRTLYLEICQQLALFLLRVLPVGRRREHWWASRARWRQGTRWAAFSTEPTLARGQIRFPSGRSHVARVDQWHARKCGTIGGTSLLGQ